jgi:DNA-binding MarR family transcriptional regulator
MSSIDGPSREFTLHVRDNCLCFHLQRAARVVARRFDEAFRPLRLTSGQYTLLMSLNRDHPPTISQVSAGLAMDRTTLTANLKPLQRRGLIQVAVDPDDRRSRRLILTPHGRRLLVQAIPLWEQTLAEIRRALSESEAGSARGPENLCADLRALT